MHPQLIRALATLSNLPTSPRSVARTIVKRVKDTRFIDDAHTRRFIAHNRRVWGDWAVRGAESLILADLYSVAETNIARSYFLNVLASRHRAEIRSFQAYGDDRSVYRVYQSFNAGGHIVPALSLEQQTRKNRLLEAVVPSITSKEALFNLRVLDTWIGVEVYESYLRNYTRPTADLDDPALHRLLDRAVSLLVYWRDLLTSRRVAAVVTSHDCYVDAGILCKVAWTQGVPVYSPNPVYLTCARSPYTFHSFFPRYREVFRAMTAEEQAEAVQLATRQLERRLDGEVGVDMPYATKSAFGAPHSRRVLRPSDRIKVLICTHCFFDNPHAYGGMLFIDFVEWLQYLGRISQRTDYDWYVKTHPDPLPGTLETIHDILADFPNITVLPEETSHHQLAAEGLDFALTVYGSIGHEYPALGVQVINAGYNPHVAYDFNWHPASMAEYEYYLLNLKTLRKDIDPREMAEFYYMHHYYRFDDDLVFDSYRKMELDLRPEDRIGPAVYSYFLDGFTTKKHRAIIDTTEAFIASGMTHHFSQGPCDGAPPPRRAADDMLTDES